MAALPIVSTNWLDIALKNNDENLVILDCSWSSVKNMEEEYAK